MILTVEFSHKDTNRIYYRSVCLTTNDGKLIRKMDLLIYKQGQILFKWFTSNSEVLNPSLEIITTDGKVLRAVSNRYTFIIEGNRKTVNAKSYSGAVRALGISNCYLNHLVSVERM